MKVLLVNGSPKAKGCTYTALQEAAAALEKQGIETEIFQVGTQPVAGCVGCGVCRKNGECFRNDVVNEFVKKAGEVDGYIFGSPIHYASASGALTSFMDRAFYSGGSKMAGKPAAAVVSCRRGGATAGFDQINKYFTINNMPVVSSQYWNMVHGNTPTRSDRTKKASRPCVPSATTWPGSSSIEAGKKAGTPSRRGSRRLRRIISAKK